MTVYKIEKDVPMTPLSVAGRGQRSEFPWGELTVGDSFVVPAEKATKASAAMRNWNARHKPIKLASARETDGGRRFWRIA